MAESTGSPGDVSKASEGEPSVAALISPIGNLLRRPKTEYIGKEGEEVVVTPSPADMLFLSKCKDCTFIIKNRAAKCVVESCSNVKVELEGALMSGTMDLIDCKDVTLRVNPQEPLQTLTAERCEGLDLHFHEPKALGSIYTVQCPKVTVHFQPPHTERNEVDLQCDQNQYVTRYADGQLTTAKVIREAGGYPTTEKELAIAEAKEEELKKKCEEYVRNLLSFATKKDVASTWRDPQQKDKKKE